MQVLQYLMDDVFAFLSTHFTDAEDKSKIEENGCANILKAFVDYISIRETENFQSRRRENENSVTLTTIHQVNFLEVAISFPALFAIGIVFFFSLKIDNIPFLLQSKGLEWDIVFIVKVWPVTNMATQLLYRSLSYFRFKVILVTCPHRL